MRKSLHPSPVHVYQSLEEGIFDPATITWSDFLKVGTKKEGTKLKGDNLPDSLTTVYARLAWKDKKHSLRPGKGGLRQNIWKTLKKSFAKRTSHPKSGSRVGSLQKWNLDPDPNVKLFVLDKINPIEHSQLNWLKITLRSNKYLSHILSHRHRESKMRYRHMRATLGLNETAKWRHQFEKDFKKLKLVNVADEEDLYIECVGFLEKEAESLKLQDKVVIGELLKKIQSICQEPSLKHITIYKGQVKIQQLVMSLPAYDLCEQHMQAALQFVLVNVMHGEPDLIVPMMKQRGLPLHPTIREQGRVSHQKLFPHKKFVRRISHDFVEVNKRLSSLPSAKAGYGKTVISQLQSNVLYNYS
ncbi:uncharacterized protein [Watersipora subatra]|uniref:uncharacterized protein isoform X1 n=1 Tax=Watersipora subatra TaxID=2589382 RepID=UPI00355C4613